MTPKFCTSISTSLLLILTLALASLFASKSRLHWPVVVAVEVAEGVAVAVGLAVGVSEGSGVWSACWAVWLWANSCMVFWFFILINSTPPANTSKITTIDIIKVLFDISFFNN